MLLTNYTRQVWQAGAAAPGRFGYHDCAMENADAAAADALSPFAPPAPPAPATAPRAVSLTGDGGLHAVAGLDATLDAPNLLLRWGPDIGPPPAPDARRVRDLAAVLRAGGAGLDPDAPAYTVYRDVSTAEAAPEIARRGLLYVAVVLRGEPLGQEQARSRGHVNSHAAGTNTVFPEVVEVWQGRALLYLQAGAVPEPPDVAVVELAPGDKAVVPPGWASLVANIGEASAPLVYGSWRARDCEPRYDALETLGGMAHFVLADEPSSGGGYAFAPNARYRAAPVPRRIAVQDFSAFGLTRGTPMFTAFRGNPDAFRFMTRPQDYVQAWTTLLAG